MNLLLCEQNYLVELEYYAWHQGSDIIGSRLHNLIFLYIGPIREHATSRTHHVYIISALVRTTLVKS